MLNPENPKNTFEGNKFIERGLDNVWFKMSHDQRVELLEALFPEVTDSQQLSEILAEAGKGDFGDILNGTVIRRLMDAYDPNHNRFNSAER